MNTCKDCIYWYDMADKGFEINIPKTREAIEFVRLGICRCHSPVDCFPNTREDDWCGEFKSKTENHET